VAETYVKISKDAAQYKEEAHGPEHCKACTYFERIAPRHCARVEGVINSQGWCKLFERKSRIAQAFKGNE
jgi:hypothetical protein